jgi:spore germination protein KC
MRSLVLLFVVVSLALSPGCGFKDIDKRIFVIAIGVDKGKEKKYEVTFKLIIPTPAIEPGKSEFQLVSRESDSISEAIKLLNSEVDKELDMGHAKIIILSSELAQENVQETLNGFIRRRDIQRIEYLALGEPSAKSILEVKPKSEILPSNSMFLIFGDEGTESPFFVAAYLFDYYRRMIGEGIDPYLPIISKTKDTFEINQMALLNKKNIVMTLNSDESGIFSQLVKKQTNLEIVASEGEIDYALSVEEIDYEYDISEINPEKTQINMTVNIEAIAEESNQRLFDKDWRELEKIAEKQIKARYLSLLEKMKSNKVDPVGFGLRYIATHSNGQKDLEKWKQIYPNAKFNIKVNVNLKGTGLIK